MVADWILMGLLFLTPRAIFDKGHEVATDDRRAKPANSSTPGRSAAVENSARRCARQHEIALRDERRPRLDPVPQW
jgi:hypothetical protein